MLLPQRGGNQKPTFTKNCSLATISLTIGPAITFLVTISNSQLLEELERLFTGKFTDLPDVLLANRTTEREFLAF